MHGMCDWCGKGDALRGTNNTSQFICDGCAEVDVDDWEDFYGCEADFAKNNCIDCRYYNECSKSSQSPGGPIGG